MTLRTAALASALLFVSTGFVSAQVAVSSGRNTSGTTSSQGAAGSGQSLVQQDLFSSSTESGVNVGQLGTGAGRFQTSQLANQPLAGGASAGNQQFNQSFNRLLQVQTLQQTGRLSRQFSGGASARSMIRPSLRVGFPVTRRPPADVSASLTRRVDKLKAQLQKLTESSSPFSGVTFEVADDGTVTLTGQASSESSRRVAASLVRMEPGVRSVTNTLTVATP